MSYDRRLVHTCPHMVVEEPLYMSANRQIVRPLRPIAAAATVRLRLNGEVEVPAYGVYTPAQATGLRSGPFTVLPGVNDRLVVSVGSEAPQILALPSGKGLDANRLVDFLNRSARGFSCVVTAKRQVRLVTHELGPLATLYVPAEDNTAAALLGLPVRRNWRGQTIVPGWNLVNDPNTLSDRPTRLIIFDTPLKGYNDFVEVSYTTIRQECRRCGGLGVEHDWRYDASGQQIRALGHELLLQEVSKIIYTVLGSNRFHLWYGTNVINAIGKKQSSSGITQNLIVSEINDAFRRWQAIKRQQEETVGQLVSDEEYPFRLSVASLEQSQQDPTVVSVTLQVQSRSGKAIDLVREVKTPMPLNLLGSTQQQQLLNQALPDYAIVK